MLMSKQNECLTHMLLRMSHSLKLLAGNRLHHEYFLPIHTQKLETKLSPDDARDTCVINKVGIRVDVLGMRERKENNC